MPRGQLTKQEIKIIILDLMNKMHQEDVGWNSDPKGVAKKYFNFLLDKIEEYAR